MIDKYLFNTKLNDSAQLIDQSIIELVLYTRILI